MSSRIPGATEPRGDTKERRSAQGPAQLRDIRDVRRTALRIFRGDVSLREILDFARWHECGVKTHPHQIPDDVTHVLAGIHQVIQWPALRDEARKLRSE